MIVRLIAHTPNPDGLCAIATKNCRVGEVPEDGGRALETALRLGHTSVAEHASFTFAIDGISRACSHQLVRHRLASYTQQSQRSVKPTGVVTPKMGDDARHVFDHAMASSLCAYEELLALGVPKEDARYVLPEATKTSLVVTMNARELQHFIDLRTDDHAQWEIRELAERMRSLAHEVAPVLIKEV